MKKVLYSLLLGFFSVPICQGCLNPTLQNVTFSATNFEYVLQWSKDTRLPNASFSVQSMRYGHNEWLFVPHCENITNTSCNLTDAIIGDVEDFMENQYYGRVRASYQNCTSKWVMSKRLNPREDTYLVLPKLSYTHDVRSISILVLNPVVKRREDGQPITVEEIYSDRTFKYHLNMYSPEKQEMWPIIQRDRKFDISGLQPNTEYNGSLYITIGEKRKSNIQYFTLKTLPDLSLVTIISVLSMLSAAVLCGVLLYFCCKYIRQHAKAPSALDFEKLRSIHKVSPPIVKHSPSSLAFAPAETLQLCNPYILQDQIGKEKPVSYPIQGSTSALPASELPMHTSIFKDQNDCNIASEVQYGEVFEKKNSTHNIFNQTYNSQRLQENGHQPLLDSGTWKDIHNIGFGFHLFPLLQQEPNIGLDLQPPLRLMSSLVVGGDSEFNETEEQTEELSAILSSDINISDEIDSLNDSSLLQEVSHYKRQFPAAATGGNLECGQPYQIQHFPGDLPVPQSV